MNPTDIPLKPKQIKEIARILYDVWETPADYECAIALKSCGYTAIDLWKFNKTKTAQDIPDQWKNNTLNTLRDMEAISLTNP